MQIMSEYDGSLTQESVLHDPDVVEWMSDQKPSGSSKPRLWGYTKEISMLATIVDAQVGKAVMKRPELPSEKLREKKNQNKLRNTLKRIGVH